MLHLTPSMFFDVLVSLFIQDSSCFFSQPWVKTIVRKGISDKFLGEYTENGVAWQIKKAKYETGPICLKTTNIPIL